MSNKLQNIKAIKQMLDGTHKFQTKKTTGFSDAKQKSEKNKKREIGEIWEEKIGNTIYTIEQKNGFRVKKPKNSVAAEVREYLNSYPNCPKETCTCTSPNHLDKKMRTIHGMCYDCVIEMEHELKKQGKYKEYEQNKIMENAKAWLKSAEQDVELLKQLYTQSTSHVQNADGLLETWEAKMTPEEFENTVQKNFETFKENFLKNINKKNDG
jgi:leucyl aminopeptidase